jgi:hypothetical protein
MALHFARAKSLWPLRLRAGLGRAKQTPKVAGFQLAGHATSRQCGWNCRPAARLFGSSAAVTSDIKKLTALYSRLTRSTFFDWVILLRIAELSALPPSAGCCLSSVTHRKDTEGGSE